MHTREMVLYPTTALAATAAGDYLVVPDGYTGMVVTITTTGSGGTSPTLNAIVQEGIRAVAAGNTTVGDQVTGTIGFRDFASFAQITGDTSREIRVSGTNGEFEGAVTDGTLTAAAINNGPLPGRIRLKNVIGGTNPAFSITATVMFIP